MFIEIPIFLEDNDPDDSTDYDKLGLEKPEYELQEEKVLLNIRDLQRVNESGSNEYNTCLWTFDGTCYHTKMIYEDVKALIMSKC